tara:strand:- start:309 stop:536 length:228 start_codon:yes stop_codon:yes gene_type:complete
MALRNSQKLHLTKAVTWRIIASVTTALIALSFGLPQKAVAGVFVADLIIKFILYYGHERAWHNLAKLFTDQKGKS